MNEFFHSETFVAGFNKKSRKRMLILFLLHNQSYRRIVMKLLLFVLALFLFFFFFCRIARNTIFMGFNNFYLKTETSLVCAVHVLNKLQCDCLKFDLLSLVSISFSWLLLKTSNNNNTQQEFRR